MGHTNDTTSYACPCGAGSVSYIVSDSDRGYSGYEHSAHISCDVCQTKYNIVWGGKLVDKATGATVVLTPEL